MTKCTHLLDRTLRLLPSFAIAAVIYLVSDGRFTAHDGRQAALTLLITVCLGLPAYWLFRVGIRYLAFWSHARGYGATAIGIVLSFALLMALIHVVPRTIGLGCMPLGLIGGIVGALEAKDKSLERRS